MKAVILAAGYGERMRPLTDTCHKTLLEVGGQSVISRIVDGLLHVGVSQIFVVTGYRADEVEEHLCRRYPNLDLRFVRNERYRQTNNIFSMALAFEHLPFDDDVILVEGDLVCEPAVFERVARSPHRDVALVDHYRTGMDGTVVTVEDGVITSVIPPHLQSGDFSFVNKFKTLNIYKFSADFCRTTFKQLLDAYTAIDANCYYELVLGILIYLKKATIFAEIIDSEHWAEIDDPNDLRMAEFTFHPEEQRKILEDSAGGYWSWDITDFCFIRNMYFPTPSMFAEIRHNLPRLLQNYGSRQSMLNEKLAIFLLCSPERVTALNGASQVYPLLATRFAGRRLLLPDPTFGEYERCFPNQARYSDRFGIDLDLVERSAGSADVIVFVNPNNPTGTTLATESLYEFAARRPDKVIVVDESFLPFSGELSMVHLLESAPLANVIVLASLSKSLGIRGARLGYAYSCDSAFNADLRQALPIWNLNSVAEHVLEIALKHRKSLAESFRTTARDRDAFAAELASLPAVGAVHPSGGNFLLITLAPEVGPAAPIADRLLQRHGMYVKDVSARMCDGRAHLRLAVRLPEEQRRFVVALDEEARCAGEGVAPGLQLAAIR